MLGGEVVESPSSRGNTRIQWSTRRKAAVIVSVLVVAFVVSVPVVYFSESTWGFHPYVIYIYTLGIASNTSDQFKVLCPFPADAEGRVCPFALTLLRVTGNATTRNVTTEYGPALEVAGNGLVVITWNSRSTLPGPGDGYEDYRCLSLLDGTSYGLGAHVYSQTAQTLFRLQFDYDYVYGNLGADFIKYEVADTLEAGWQILSVDYSHAVA